MKSTEVYKIIKEWAEYFKNIIGIFFTIDYFLKNYNFF